MEAIDFVDFVFWFLAAFLARGFFVLPAVEARWGWGFALSIFASENEEVESAVTSV